MDSIIIKKFQIDTNYFYSIGLQASIKKDRSFTLSMTYNDNIFINDYSETQISIDNLPENFILTVHKWQMEKFDIIKEFFYKFNIKEIWYCNFYQKNFFYLERRLWNTKCAIK